MIIHGRDLIVKLGGVAIAGARSCELNVSGEAIETSSATQGSWRTYIPGRKGWNVTANHLVTAVTSNAAKVGTVVTLTFGKRDSSEVLTGQAIVTGWRCTATLGNLSQGVFSFQGSGPLEEVE